MEEDMKRCSKCKTISLKNNFNGDKTKNDGFNPICKVCRIGYYNKKREQGIEYAKLYARQNRARINAYERQKRLTDSNYKLGHKIRAMTRQAFNLQNIKRTNKTIDLIGCSQTFLRKWILHQLYGDMTEENYGKIWCLDHT